ncbi:hypothetical protein B0H17DRAFT_1065009 [Mycena rosella]|uniref:Uncharacterized protein n=1 Tax=Mycena rosella TaxID=1033263 RepID=A0AAD7GI95_MYCRO|nr:hypothetical protein B0H17DRAFT_1065009 [Mycena rosella]
MAVCGRPTYSHLSPFFFFFLCFFLPPCRHTIHLFPGSLCLPMTFLVVPSISLLPW